MSKILENIHENVRGFFKSGVIDDITMREFDVLCLPPSKIYSSEDVRRIRADTRMSQTVFAAHLGVAPSTVRQWEQGAKHPRGPSAKLLDIIERKGIEAIS
jgi:putative transcriptional regulator